MTTNGEAERRLAAAYEALVASGRIVESADLQSGDRFYVLNYDTPGHSLPELLRSGEFVGHEPDGRVTVRLDAVPTNPAHYQDLLDRGGAMTLAGINAEEDQATEAAKRPVTATLEALGFTHEISGQHRSVALVKSLNGISYGHDRRSEMLPQGITELPRRTRR